MGQQASILLRPRLFINGRKTSVSSLVDCKAQVVITDFEDLITKIEFDALKFTDNEEKIVSFQVPPNSKHIELSLNAKVMVTSTRSFRSLSSPKQTIKI